MAIGVVQADLERLQPAQHRRADPARADGADLHALEVVRARDRVGDVPAAVEDDLVRGDVVADEREDHHHDVLGDADAVRVADLGDGQPAVDCRLQVDVVRADPGRDGELQVRRLGDPLRRQVRGPERLGDDDLRLGQLPLEDRVGTVLVGRDRELVPALLEEPAQPELAGDAPEQLARREVDRLRRRRRGPVVVAVDLRDAVPGVRGRIPAHRVVVEHAEHVRHGAILTTLSVHAALSVAVRAGSELAEALDRVGRRQALDLDLPRAQLFERGRNRAASGRTRRCRGSSRSGSSSRTSSRSSSTSECPSRRHQPPTTRFGRTMTSFVCSSPSTSTPAEAVAVEFRAPRLRWNSAPPTTYSLSVPSRVVHVDAPLPAAVDVVRDVAAVRRPGQSVICKPLRTPGTRYLPRSVATHDPRRTIPKEGDARPSGDQSGQQASLQCTSPPPL